MTGKNTKRSPGDAGRIGILLRRLADLVERSSTDEIDALLRGNGELRIYEVNSASRTVGIKCHHSYIDTTFSEVSEKLHASQTREAGSELLSNEFPTKVSIEKFARFLDLPVHRTDTIETLREKIVESEIGSKLRSDAVQGRKVK